ncbi:extracellular solute-binding protein [Ensifer canadensis]
MVSTSAFAQEPKLPEYYPADYGQIVEASRKEAGLVVYSNMADNNWQPVIKGFNELYPWIKIETLDLGSGTVHTRWEAEAGSGARTADILVSGANDRWARYGSEGRMLDYASPETERLPGFANPYPGHLRDVSGPARHHLQCRPAAGGPAPDRFRLARQGGSRRQGDVRRQDHHL